MCSATGIERSSLATQVTAMVVENTFTSIEDVAPKLLPILSPILGKGRCENMSSPIIGFQCAQTRALPPEA